jgi:tellurite methyltransferase
MNFNEFYSKQKYYFSQRHSDGMAECLATFAVSPCRAVDLGAGEGRNSLYLASLGFEVIAIEPSHVGAEKIRSRCKEASLYVDVLESDFLSCSDRLKDVGFLVALTSLEHMEYEYMIKAIEKIKDILSLGAYVYIMVFTEEDPGFKKDMSNSSECALFIKHYFRKGELKDLFSDFEILKYAEYLKEDFAHGNPHYHGKAKLFAKKRI